MWVGTGGDPSRWHLDPECRTVEEVRGFRADDGRGTMLPCAYCGVEETPRERLLND